MSDNKINIVLDATMLDTFLMCPAKFNYRFNLNKTTLEKGAALDKGGVAHVGFEAYYKALQARQSFGDCLKLAHEAIDLYVANEEDSTLESNEINFIHHTIEENLKHWQFEDNKFEILDVEKPFMYILHEDDDVRIVMIGKIDLLVNVDSYRNLPIDHKTFSRSGPVYRKTNQFCNYVYATQSNYLLVNRVGLQTSLKPQEKFKRLPLSYDPLFLEQWKQNVIKWCYYYLDCVVNKSWPLNDTSCDKFNRLCEYYEICDSSGVDAKIYKLEVNFKTAEKWDVSKALGEKK